MSQPWGSLVIQGGKVLLQGGEIRTCDVFLEKGRIEKIGQDLQADSRIDAQGTYVLPGLTDLHTHGMGLQSARTGDLREYARIEASRGATTLCPTLFEPPEKIADHLRKHRLETSELRELPQIAGFRLESPYQACAGAGLPEDLVPIDARTTQLLLEAGGGHIKIWDVSPELRGAADFIREISSQGIIASISHTKATPDEARAAVDAGASLVTHMFDTFSVPQMSDPGVYPAGLVDYLLVEDRVTCEIIGDGTHVHPLLVEKAFRCKTPARIAFVTDSLSVAGLPPGTYKLPEDGQKVLLRSSNDGIRHVDRGMGLAGSALTPIDAFRNVVRLFGKDIRTASRVCSRTPASVMRLNKGEIAPGKDADLIVLDSDLEILYTIGAGKVIYQRQR